MEKHYQCKNADKEFVIGKFKFTFAKTHYNEATMTYWGLYSTKSEAEQTLLAQGGSQNGIFEVSGKDAAILLEKKSMLRSPVSVTDFAHSQKVRQGNDGRVEVVEDEEESQEEKDAIDESLLMADEPSEETEENENISEERETKPKRKRGRPRKKPLIDG